MSPYYKVFMEEIRQQNLLIEPLLNYGLGKPQRDAFDKDFKAKQGR